jgi:hypothetical protein
VSFNVHTTILFINSFLAAVKLEEVQELGLKVVCLGLHSDVKAAAVIAMESRICTALSFCLHAPTVDSFVPRYTKAAGFALGSRGAHLVTYLAELAFTCATSLRYS